MSIAAAATRPERTDASEDCSSPVAVAVMRALTDMCLEYDREVAIRFDSSLVDDLGFDSLMFVELTVSLEDRLGVGEFPMRAWADEEARTKGVARFTVRSLVRTCTALAQGEAKPRG